MSPRDLLFLAAHAALDVLGFLLFALAFARAAGGPAGDPLSADNGWVRPRLTEPAPEPAPFRLFTTPPRRLPRRRPRWVGPGSFAPVPGPVGGGRG